jgi:hypothetical protein
MISRFGFVFDDRTMLCMLAANVFDARTTLLMLAANVFDARTALVMFVANIFDARRIGVARSDGQREYV